MARRKSKMVSVTNVISKVTKTVREDVFLGWGAIIHGGKKLPNGGWVITEKETAQVSDEAKALAAEVAETATEPEPVDKPAKKRGRPAKKNPNA